MNEDEDIPEWKERLERMQQANWKKDSKTYGKFSASKMSWSRDNKHRCDMCSKKYAKTTEMRTINQMTYCKRCWRNKMGRKSQFDKWDGVK